MRRSYKYLDSDLIFYAPLDAEHGLVDLISGNVCTINANASVIQFDNHIEIGQTSGALSGSQTAIWTGIKGISTYSSTILFDYNAIRGSGDSNTSYIGPLLDDANANRPYTSAVQNIVRNISQYPHSWGSFGLWYNLADAYADRFCRCYKNGVLTHTLSVRQNYAQPISSMGIWSDNYSGYARIKLKNIMIFQRALTLEEIKYYQNIA